MELNEYTFLEIISDCLSCEHYPGPWNWLNCCYCRCSSCPRGSKIADPFTDDTVLYVRFRRWWQRNPRSKRKTQVRGKKRLLSILSPSVIRLNPLVVHWAIVYLSKAQHGEIIWKENHRRQWEVESSTLYRNKMFGDLIKSTWHINICLYNHGATSYSYTVKYTQLPMVIL